MKKLEKCLITTLLAGLVTFSWALPLPTQIAQAIGTSQIENNTKMSSNGTVTTSTGRLDKKVMVKQRYGHTIRRCKVIGASRT
jgi:hypothetical protein